MPANKNQHYVPKCHLKPFSLNGEGHAINLVNINSGKCIPNASTRGQCSKDYLYGKDQKLENILKGTEGRYGTIIKKIQDKIALTLDELEELRAFAWLQYCRTEMAFTRLRKAKEMMREAAYRGYESFAEEIDLSEQRMMQSSMLQYARTLYTLRDLAVHIIHNQSQVDFVTSDDPAILTNRFQIQRLGTENAGTESAGALLFLPLTPRHMLMCFDKDIYRFGYTNGTVVLNRSADVLSFNQFQYIKAEKNIYHRAAEDAELILTGLQQAQPLRPTTWHKVETTIITREEPGRTYIRQASSEETLHAPRRMVGLKSVLPKPDKWPSIIRYKLRPRYFYDGSLAGHLRLAAAQDMLRRSRS